MKSSYKQGGKRPNAGRKLKYGEVTVNVTFRVPQSCKYEVMEIVNEYLKKKYDEHANNNRNDN